MSDFNDPKLQERLRQLEAELPQTPQSSLQAQSQTPSPSASSRSSASSKFSIQKLGQWFNGLSGGARTVVALGGVVAGLMVLGALLKLVTQAVSLALLLGGLYLVYQLFFRRDQTPQ
ncbi:hypothetical protein [Leptolyngbya sp. FACHB-261]|uniref:hypothetical protein n=1 Tax=Leptolyngbya sp. FACHB-261 TaxID=2692806 RepID=UPI001685A3F9|nr:hypothetical protein [Leptolyngbya sp. FACHB-261]MBD2105255.1 hypothetical protein [Leptolyngbya sp. FACHB-261]